MKVRFRNMPSLSVLAIIARPSWRWPQGCSRRPRRTTSGIRVYSGLKKPMLPRHAFVMFVAAAAPPIVAAPVVGDTAGAVSAAQELVVGIWLVSVKEGPNGP